MRKKKTFKINELEWTLDYQPRSVMDVYYKGVLGVCILQTTTIVVNDELKGEHLKRVILHELIHAFFYSYARNNENITEEDVAEFVEVHFHEIEKIINKLTKEKEN